MTIERPRPRYPHCHYVALERWEPYVESDRVLDWCRKTFGPTGEQWTYARDTWVGTSAATAVLFRDAEDHALTVLTWG